MKIKFVKDTLAVCIPASGPIEPIVLSNFMAAVNYAARNGIKVEYFELTNRVLIHIARNRLAKQFLKSDAEWSLWLDSDMLLPRETIPELLKWAKALDSKLVSALYCHRVGNYVPMALLNSIRDKKGRLIRSGKTKYHGFSIDIPKPVKDAVEVDFCGFGCILIHREVFEKMKFPYFKFLLCDDIKGLAEDECVMEDNYFLTSARELGYKVYVLPSLELGHIADPLIIKRCDHDRKKMELARENPSLLDLRLIKNGGVHFVTRGLKP